jgi:hypothetical protein
MTHIINICNFINPFNSVIILGNNPTNLYEKHSEQLTQIIENENIHRTDMKTFDGLKKLTRFRLCTRCSHITNHDNEQV